MWNKPNKEQFAAIPRLYTTEKIGSKDKIVHLHFFIGGCDWYVAEFDGEELFFGYANLNDAQNAEWGYFSLASWTTSISIVWKSTPTCIGSR